MKKLTSKQMFDLVDYLTECYEDAGDVHYSLMAVNHTLKTIGYANKFEYDYENESVICDGGIEQQESE